MKSALYVPGDKPTMLAKALGLGADALIVDLEDAVPLSDKQTARSRVAAWLDTLGADTGPEIWVRVNPGALGLADLRAVAHPRVAGVCLAKTESPDDPAAADRVLADAPWIRISPLLESAAAVLAAAEIARAPRVTRLQLGEADLCADLGITPGPDERELLWARSHIVMAGAAARIHPPLAPVGTDFRDLDRFRASTEALKRLGFRGRACIHPAQLPVVRDVFTPTAEEVAEARALVERFDAAGTGVLLDPEGRMVDEATLRQARGILAAEPPQGS